MTAMLWMAAMAALALFAGLRWGFRGAALAVAAMWLAGLGWLARGDGFLWAAGLTLTARLWALGGAAVLIALGYAALLSRLRARASRLAPAGPGMAAPLAGDAGITAMAAAPSPAGASPESPPDPSGPLTDDELDRYARHIVLRELGGAGQRRLRAARLLVVGAGGVGAPVLLYLAAAGVGRITVADDDTVSLSNLQRQVIFGTADIGRPKAEAAAEAMRRLNSHVTVSPLIRRITADDTALVADHDLVLDGTDSFASRAAINAACVAARVPLLAGAITQWEGQIALYDPARGGPCLACLFPEPPAPGLALSCAEAGVVGALPGIIGSSMALEAIKLLAGVTGNGAGEGLRERMVLIDGLWGDTRRLRIAARTGCAVCGA